MKPIHYIKGDTTKPVGDGKKIIAHVCNDLGGWGRGFVVAISNRWKEPEASYRAWCQSKENFELNEIQVVECSDEISVANMIAQHKIRPSADGEPPIRYEALSVCLSKLRDEALTSGASIHMPRIGCGLAGGEWSEVEKLILTELCSHDVEVTVYDFE